MPVTLPIVAAVDGGVGLGDGVGLGLEAGGLGVGVAGLGLGVGCGAGVGAGLTILATRQVSGITFPGKDGRPSMGRSSINGRLTLAPVPVFNRVPDKL